MSASSFKAQIASTFCRAEMRWGTGSKRWGWVLMGDGRPLSTVAVTGARHYIGAQSLAVTGGDPTHLPGKAAGSVETANFALMIRNLNILKI